MKMTGKFRWTSSWFLSIHIVLHLLLIFVQGNEEADDAFANGKHLVLEYFLPVNLPQSNQIAREKRDVEGSGDETNFSDVSEDREWRKASNSSEAAIEKVIDKSGSSLVGDERNFYEGSGEVDFVSERDKEHSSLPPILEEESDERNVESSTVQINYGTESSRSEKAIKITTIEDYTQSISTDEISTDSSTGESIKESGSDSENDSTEISVESTSIENSTEESVPTDISVNLGEFVTVISTTYTDHNEQSTEKTTKSEVDPLLNHAIIEKHKGTTTEEEESSTVVPPTSMGIPKISVIESERPKESTTIGLVKIDTPGLFSHKNISSPSPVFNEPSSTQGISLEPVTSIKTPVEEVIFKETKISHETMAAPPGNILQKKNMTLGVDPLLIITNTRLVDSDNADLDKDDSRRLGAYIVIALILLSFFSLLGYFVFKRRQFRKRQDFESNPESQETEKALLSLTDYKDNSELEENHLKNNEITPIVVKSNSQINKFEKNTNFSSPKNLNTTANEKNIEKDNVLKSTTENLTQVIIEDSPKEVEEDKNVPCTEKLIVKTRLDPDSIPKKPIIVNRTSAGYIPIPKDIV